MNETGWKVDTGHKLGYLLYIEKKLAKKLPNANIKADPHIASKIKLLKKHLSWVLDIQQSGSGFGWDDERKMVAGEKDQFIGWAKSRPGAAALYGKPFLNYDKLYEVYASDLAKGSMAKGPGDQLDLNEDPCTINLMEAPMDVEAETEPQSEPSYHSTSPSNGTKHGGGRKRTLVEEEHVQAAFASISKTLEGLLVEAEKELLVEAEKENIATMKEIKTALVHEVEVQKQIDAQASQLFRVLCALPGFTDEEIIKAACIIAKDVATLKLFFITPVDKKCAFIRLMIATGGAVGCNQV